MGTTWQEIRRLRKEMRDARKDIDRMRTMLERESRIDSLIDQMKRSAREMLLVSRGL